MKKLLVLRSSKSGEALRVAWINVVGIFLSLIILNLSGQEGFVLGVPGMNERLEGQPAISHIFQAALNLNPKLRTAFEAYTQDHMVPLFLVKIMQKI